MSPETFNQEEAKENSATEHVLSPEEEAKAMEIIETGHNPDDVQPITSEDIEEFMNRGRTPEQIAAIKAEKEKGKA